MLDVRCHNGLAKRDRGRGSGEAWYEGVESRVPSEICMRGSRLRLGWIRGKGSCKGAACGGVWGSQRNRVCTMSEVTVEWDLVEHSTCWGEIGGVGQWVVRGFVASLRERRFVRGSCSIVGLRCDERFQAFWRFIFPCRAMVCRDRSNICRARGWGGGRFGCHGWSWVGAGGEDGAGGCFWLDEAFVSTGSFRQEEGGPRFVLLVGGLIEHVGSERSGCIPEDHVGRLEKLVQKFLCPVCWDNLRHASECGCFCAV